MARPTLTAWPRDDALRQFRAAIPHFSTTLKKGQAGRVAIVGGCEEYTGAPYFAGMSALRCGADLVHIFCSHRASVPIKSYSPELIVHPYLHESDLPPVIGDGGLPDVTEGEHASKMRVGTEKAVRWLKNIDTLVVGPGLGRDPSMLRSAYDMAMIAKEEGKYLIFDGDGTQIPLRIPECVYGYQKAIITPNVVEFDRLFSRFRPSVKGISSFQIASGNWEEDEVEALENEEGENVRKVAALARFYDGVTIVKKGDVDIISDGISFVQNRKEGSLRRCGGQGDILSGSIGAFTVWAGNGREEERGREGEEDDDDMSISVTMKAAVGGSSILRRAALYAFREKKRSMITGDVLECLPQAFHTLFDDAVY
mmetsp:Transcript_50162/g.129107  ORF Transcript_50162/g.129107 Transcript_50162/m.129107 type:complete len:368 (-) Transcript_50162:122-1225(-)